MLAAVQAVLGDDATKLIVDGRVAHWTIQAKTQARQVRELKVSANASRPATSPTGEIPTEAITVSIEKKRLSARDAQALVDPEGWKLVKRVVKEVGLESFLSDHRLTKTPVTDYMGGRIKNRVSAEMQKAIVEGARATATKLGLETRNNSE